MSWLSDIAGIGSVIGGIISLFDQPSAPRLAPEQQALLAAQTAAANRSAAIAQALSDPSSPMFRNLATQQEGQIRGDLLEALGQLRVQNQRATARTGMGILNPERRDESIAMATARGFMDAQQQARDNARNYLEAAAKANNAAVGSLGATVGQAFNREQVGFGVGQANRRDRASGIAAAFQGLSRLDDSIFGNRLLDGSENLQGGGRGGGGGRNNPLVYETR